MKIQNKEKDKWDTKTNTCVVIIYHNAPKL